MFICETHGVILYGSECLNCKKEGNLNKPSLNPGLPTREDIERLAKNDKILYTALRVGENQKLKWEDTIMLAVKCLVKRNHETQKTFIEYVEKLGTPSFFVKKSG